MRRSYSDLAHLPDFKANICTHARLWLQGIDLPSHLPKKNVMYTAMLLICHMYAMQPCVVVVDDWGPYKTKDECMARIEVMVGNVQQITPFMVVSGAKCDNEVGEAT